MSRTNKDYWEGRYREDRLGWDIGYASPPIQKFIDGLDRKDLRILVPGAGHGYEVAYLWQQGYQQVYALDIAPTPLNRIREQLPDFPESQLLEADFFQLDLPPFDLVLEQTFFCSFDPALRPDYVEKMHELIVPGGTLAGLFFEFPLSEQGPPFGGSREAYRALFEKHFKIRRLERAYNSIGPRQGNELFFIFTR